MRVIFLDFDGVLHPVGTQPGSPEAFRWIHILCRLLVDPGDVKLIVHSTWRYSYRESELRKLIQPLGFLLAGVVPPMPRELAIETVLQSNRVSIRSHLVLDDSPDEFCHGHVNLVVCDPELGISAKSVQVAIEQWLRASAP